MKLLYNVTIKIDINVRHEWMDWICNKHIPDIMATGCFETYKLTRILDEEDENGVGFAIQYVSPSQEAFQRYQEQYAQDLQKEHAERYKGKYVAFRTLMVIENEG